MSFRHGSAFSPTAAAVDLLPRRPRLSSLLRWTGALASAFAHPSIFLHEHLVDVFAAGALPPLVPLLVRLDALLAAGGDVRLALTARAGAVAGTVIGTVLGTMDPALAASAPLVAVALRGLVAFAGAPPPPLSLRLAIRPGRVALAADPAARIVRFSSSVTMPPALALSAAVLVPLTLP